MSHSKPLSVMTMFTKYLKENYKFLTIAVAIVVSAVIIASQLGADRQLSGKNDLADAKTAIGRHILLPTDEEPTLAIVENTSQLSSQFLKDNAKKGDEILVYANHGQAIIYRPSIAKIVAVSPVTVDLGLAEAEGTTIQVLNGTSDATIVDTVKKEIENKYPNAKVTTGTAQKRDFPNTIVIDNTDEKDNLVEGLLSTIRAKRGVVPLSETAGSSNILIIVGTDRL